MGAAIKALVHKSGTEELGDFQKSFFEFKVKDIEGTLIDFSIYKGKKAILIVNVACKWGLTSSNYKLLTQMYN